MKLKTTVAMLCALLLFGSFPLQATSKINNLKVEYQTNPLGIDVTHPRFNWQMTSDKQGAAQTAYQVLVALSPEQLRNGQTVFDSGKISSSESVGITYNGQVLKPSTRYYWTVKVWDESGSLAEAPEAWFETGLTDGNWSNAKWIGSSLAQLSKYRSLFVIDYDVAVANGSQNAVFVFGARDAKNFVSVDLNVKEATFTIRHTKEGKESLDTTVRIPNLTASDKHHVTLDVSSSNMQSYSIKATIDDNHLTPAKSFTVSPYSDTELVHLCRLYAIGSNQPKGESALFSNIRISEKSWNTTLYTMNENYQATEGLKTWFPSDGNSAPMLRKTITLDKPIQSARLYATARGIYEFNINGKRVGEDFFNPGWTDYRFRFMYNTYDITSLLQSGKNGIGVQLGTGWWSDHMGYMSSWQDQYGIHQSVMAKIVVTFTDGTKQTFTTNGSWKCFDNGPITSNSILNGEDYDARKEITGWSTGNFDDASWKEATVYEAPAINTNIQAYIGSPIRNNVTLTAKSMAEPQPKVYVYDMGQNMVGVPSFKLKGKAGQEITIRYGEMNYPTQIPTKPVAPYTIDIYKQRKGQVYTDNYRSALSTDHFILKGDADGELFEPHFTSHGFRYIEIIGLDAPLALNEVKGLVLESIGEQTSGYETSDKRINRLFENIVWGQRGNFLSVPTDCPQRDERLGWSGDAQVFSRTATYNMNVDPFYTRWLYSLRDNQGKDGNFCNFFPSTGNPPEGAELGGGFMGWTEVGLIVPWQVYQQYGDIRVLEQHYAAMVAYMDYLERSAVRYIQPIGGYGDWLAPDPSNTMLTNTAYSAYDALIMEQVATRLGKTDDAKRFHTFYENIKKSFNELFVDADGRTIAPAVSDIFGNSRKSYPLTNAEQMKGGKVDTQTSYVVPLQFGLFNEQNKPLAVKHLVENIEKHNYTLTTGFIGTPYLNLVLSDNGHDDVAYKLFQQTAYPSWLYPVMQGATTIWERWNSYTIINGFGPVDMNSFNHYSYGAIEEWMMAYSAGIQRDEQNPGYKHFILQPRIGDGFSFIKAHFDCAYGRIESGWQTKGKTVTYEATVPANTTATLYIPTSDASKVKFLSGAENAKFISSADDKVIYHLPSGTYKVTF